mgnify:CR=1 FL=1
MLSPLKFGIGPNSNINQVQSTYKFLLLKLVNTHKWLMDWLIWRNVTAIRIFVSNSWFKQESPRPHGRLSKNGLIIFLQHIELSTSPTS